MPFNYKKTEQVRERLLEKNSRWQAELDKIGKASKDAVVKALGNQVSDVADELVAATAFHAEEIRKTKESVHKAVSASSTALESSTAALEAQEEIAKDLKEKDSKIEINSKRALKSINERHKIELERSQNVVIARGIPPLVEGKESYNDLETALFTGLKRVGIKKGHITVHYIRRLAKSGGDKGKKDKEPRALRVELSSLGDKIRLYEAVIETSKTKAVDFNLSSEIPRYALPKYKRLGKLARALRDDDNRLKTKVTIPRGKLMPVLQLKLKGSGESYKAATEEQLKAAAELWNKSQTDKDAKLLESDDDMDTDSKPGN